MVGRVILHKYVQFKRNAWAVAKVMASGMKSLQQLPRFTLAAAAWSQHERETPLTRRYMTKCLQNFLILCRIRLV